MLYNNGDQFNQIYYNGNPVSQIWKNGECIYPGKYEPFAIMVGFISLPSEIASTIVSIKRSNAEPATEYQAVDVSGSISGYDQDSKYVTYYSNCPIYMWVDDTILYWYSLAKHVKIVGLGGRKSSTPGYKAFFHYPNLVDISGLRDWDIGWVNSTFSSLHNRDYYNDLSLLFTDCNMLEDISPLSNWDVSHVTDALETFLWCHNITNIDTLYCWDISRFTDMRFMFGQCDGLSATPKLQWNLATNANKSGIFQLCHNLNNIDSILDLTTDAEKIGGILMECTSLEYALNLRWKLSGNVLTDVFEFCSSLKAIDFSLCEVSDSYLLPYELCVRCVQLEICDMGSIFSSTYYKNTTVGAFWDCPKLRTVIIRNANIKLSRDRYSDGLHQYFGANNGIIYVPTIQLNNYLNDPEWIRLISNGASILPLEGSIYEEPGSVSALYS